MIPTKTMIPTKMKKRRMMMMVMTTMMMKKKKKKMMMIQNQQHHPLRHNRSRGCLILTRSTIPHLRTSEVSQSAPWCGSPPRPLLRQNRPRCERRLAKAIFRTSTISMKLVPSFVLSIAFAFTRRREMRWCHLSAWRRRMQRRRSSWSSLGRLSRPRRRRSV